MQLVKDKISVPEPEQHTPRQRLISALGESLEHCSASVVFGRAGTGKTTLAADFARRCGRPVAWFKVGASDVELGSFARYLAAAIDGGETGFCADAISAVLDGDSGASVTDVADAFVAELLDREEPLLLVVDDFHLVYDAEWLVPFFGRLLPLLPRDAHMLLLGRTLPPAPLWRMRSKQAMCVIDEAALAFNENETIELFHSYGVTSDRAAALLGQTYGRAALLDAIARQLAFSAALAAASSAPVPTLDHFRERLVSMRGGIVGAA